MKCVLIFLVAVLARSTSVQGAPMNQDESEIGLASHPSGSQKSQLNRDYGVLLQLQKDYKKYDYCNGVRLNKHWVLTLAECLEKPKYTHVRLTFPDYGTFVHKHYHFNALDYALHPKYDAKTKKNNIALIKDDFTDLPESQRLKLHGGKDDGLPHIGKRAEVTILQSSIDSDTKKEFQLVNTFSVEVVSHTICRGLFPEKSDLRDQICVVPIYKGQPQTLKKGHLGAPLVLEDGTLFGIANQVSSLPDKWDQPIVFHRITSYVPWIHDKTGIQIST